MAQRQQTKQFHTFVGGLNTEVSPLVFPDHTAVDLDNMELNIDGSLTRRKGLAVESGPSVKAIHAGFVNGTDAVTEHFWRNAAGNDEHLHIVQTGYNLYFYSDDPTTMGTLGAQIDIRGFIPAGATVTDAEIGAAPVDISWGRGQALCTNKYTDPFYLTYNPVTSVVTAELIQIRTRDFVGVVDLVGDTIHPSSLSDAHSYNLQNAGWTAANIAQYNTDESEYPSKNQLPGKAFLRTLTASTSYDHDGTLVYSSTKLAAELFGDAPAPMGHFIINPFAASGVASGTGLEIVTWDFDAAVTPGVPQDRTITLPTGHGDIATDEIVVAGQQSRYLYKVGSFTWPITWSFDGVYTIDSVLGDDITITVTGPTGWNAWLVQYESLGGVYASTTGSGEDLTDLRPTTNAFFAGRAWYAGTPAGTLGQRVLFSQIIQTDNQYGKCYQRNDPTNLEFPDLVESDGGEIFIPEAGRVLKLQPFGHSMLVFCDNGVWEIDGGANRYFDAIDFTVRRVTGAPCVSRESVVEADNQIFYASDEGAFRVFVDPEARVLVAENMTREKTQTLWSAIDPLHKASMKTIYDPLKLRIIFMYDDSASPTASTWNYTKNLVFDTRLGSWFPHTFPTGTDFATDTYIKGFVKPERYTRDGEAIIKYLTWNANGIQWNELTDDTDFQDLAEIDAAGYIVTGYEAMGDHSKDKQVRYLSTFMQRIEDSSLSMRGRWDFADADISGKWSPSVEAYRPPRLWVGAHGEDGYPVVVSKHTLPGQGQVLSIRYDTAAGEDAVLYGWTVDFQGIQD